MAIQSFAQFQPEYNRLQEAKKLSATQWEQVIVIAFNGGWNKKSDTFGISEAEYRSVAPIAEKIAQDIKRATNATRTEMLHFGTGGGESIRMVEWWKGKNTPKTDCYTTNGVRVSLKKQGGSQLISGLKDETLSTFTAATKYLNASENVYASLLSEIEDVLSQRVKAGEYTINMITQVADDIEQYRKLSEKEKAQLASIGIESEADVQQWIDDVITFKKGDTRTVSSIDREAIFDAAKKMVGIRKEFQKLTPVVQDWFENNREFKMWFTYEAASGHLKFSPTPKASANWIVEFDTNGGANEVNRLEEASSTSSRIIPSAYLRNLSQKTTFRLSFKTSTGSGKGGTSAVSFRSSEKTKKQLEKERMVRTESVSALEYFAESAWRDIMESVLLQEGIWDSVKSSVASVYRTIVEWVSRIVAKLRELLANGIDAFLAFIGIEIENVEVDGIDMLFSE